MTSNKLEHNFDRLNFSAFLSEDHRLGEGKRLISSHLGSVYQNMIINAVINNTFVDDVRASALAYDLSIPTHTQGDKFAIQADILDKLRTIGISLPEGFVFDSSSISLKVITDRHMFDSLRELEGVEVNNSPVEGLVYRLQQLAYLEMESPFYSVTHDPQPINSMLHDMSDLDNPSWTELGVETKDNLGIASMHGGNTHKYGQYFEGGIHGVHAHALRQVRFENGHNWAQLVRGSVEEYLSSKIYKDDYKERVVSRDEVTRLRVAGIVFALDYFEKLLPELEKVFPRVD